MKDFTIIFCHLLSLCILVFSFPAYGEEDILKQMDKAYALLERVRASDTGNYQQAITRVKDRYGTELSKATSEMARSVMAQLRQVKTSMRRGNLDQISKGQENLAKMVERFERLNAYNEFYGKNREAGKIAIFIDRTTTRDTLKQKVRMQPGTPSFKYKLEFPASGNGKKVTLKLTQAQMSQAAKSGFVVYSPMAKWESSAYSTFPQHNFILNSARMERYSRTPNKSNPLKGLNDISKPRSDF